MSLIEKALFCCFILQTAADLNPSNLAFKTGQYFTEKANIPFPPKARITEFDDLDFSEEFENLFTMGSSESDFTSQSGKLTITYMTFGLVLGGLFLLGVLTSVGWRSYKRKGGTAQSLFKTLCGILTCKCLRKKKRGQDGDPMELEESLLSTHEEENFDSGEDEENPTKSKVQKTGLKMSFLDEKELNKNKNLEELFLEFHGGNQDEQANALAQLYQHFRSGLSSSSQQAEQDALATLLKANRYAVTKPTQSALLSLDFDEDKYQAKLDRYATEIFPRISKRLGTWTELTEHDVICRMHPISAGEHDHYMNDDTTVVMLKDLKKCYTWDYCLVFTLGDKDKKLKIQREAKPGQPEPAAETVNEMEHFQRETARVIGALTQAQLQVAVYFSIQRDEIYCLVGASEDRLIRQAEQMSMVLLLDPKKLRERAFKEELNLTKHEEIGDDVYEEIYAPFKNFKARRDNRHELYKRFNEGKLHPDTVFRTVDRLKLTAAIISDEVVLGGAALPISKYKGMKKHPLLSFYPLDEVIEKEELRRISYPMKRFLDPPLDEFRGYFGEQVAMYFAFLASYTRWLIVPAVTGMCFLVWQIAAATVDVPGISAFGVLVAIWASLFLENWRHVEARLRSRWGQQSHTAGTGNRAEFDGDWIVSRVDGEIVEAHLTHKRLRRTIASNMVLVMFLCVVLGGVASIFFLRKLLETAIVYQWSMTLTAIVNTIEIQFMNFLYSKISTHLNNFENHQTDTQYFNSMITKTFIFKFVNCYNTFIYIGMFKKYDASNNYCEGSFLQYYNKAPISEHPLINTFVKGLNTTSPQASGLSTHGLAAVSTLSHGPNYRGDCMYELAHNLGVIFATMIFISNFVEVFTPWVHRYMKNRKETKTKTGEEAAKLSEPERQYMKDEYESTFGDYEELCVQFGYVTLFVVAFPATPMLALMNNIVEYRIDATKLVDLVRRPIPRSAGDIGTWYSVLNIVSWIALITNLVLILFASSSVTKGKSAAFVLAGFIVAEHILFFIKLLIGMFYKGEPASVKEHNERQEFLVGKLIGR